MVLVGGFVALTDRSQQLRGWGENNAVYSNWNISNMLSSQGFNFSLAEMFMRGKKKKKAPNPQPCGEECADHLLTLSLPFYWW